MCWTVLLRVITLRLMMMAPNWPHAGESSSAQVPHALYGHFDDVAGGDTWLV